MALKLFHQRGGGDIHSLARAGRVAKIRRLLAREPDLIAARTDFGATPLHCAAYEGHAEVVRLLLDLGADAKAEDVDGQTALEIARAAEKADVIRVLMDHAKGPGPRTASEGRIEDQVKRTVYDFFISYKSENVDLARTVADHLTASGLKVWFAEYEILLYDRDQFEMEIDDGIRHSRYGLVFLNDLYATSKHCGREIAQLEAHKPEYVLIARIPDQRAEKGRFEEIPIDRAVEACRRHDRAEFKDILDTLGVKNGKNGLGKMFSVGSVLARALRENTLLDEGANANAVLGFVEARTKRPIVKMASPAAERDSFWGSLLGADFSLDVSGWRRVDPGSRAMIDKGQGARFERAAGKEKLLVNLYFDRDASEEGKSRMRPPSPDDRELYDALREYAKRHMTRLNAKIRGVHLLFHGGYSQLALTYQLPGYWTRKYSVTVNHPQFGTPVEFVFTFGYTGPFEGYCLNAHLMDSLVKSLKWD